MFDIQRWEIILNNLSDKAIKMFESACIEGINELEIKEINDDLYDEYKIFYELILTEIKKRNLNHRK